MDITGIVFLLLVVFSIPLADQINKAFTRLENKYQTEEDAVGGIARLYKEQQ